MATSCTDETNTDTQMTRMGTRARSERLLFQLLMKSVSGMKRTTPSSCLFQDACPQLPPSAGATGTKEGPSPNTQQPWHRD